MDERESKAPRRSGYYIYGIVPGDHPGPDQAVVGVSPEAPVEKIGLGALAALVARVSVDDFDEDSLTDPAEGLRTLEAKVRGHEAVLESALASGAVVPMRFGTTCVDPDEVRGVLARHEGELSALLRKVSGRSEWTVRGTYDREVLVRWVAANNDEIEVAGGSEELGPGRAYWAQRKTEDLLAHELERVALEWAQRCHDRLGGTAVESAWNAPGRFGEGDAPVVLNGAYLVEDSERDRFMHAVDELRDLFAERGFHLDVVGPWPPYEFGRLGSSAIR
jgi:Gas vesicle synthesis protein GvpL/GvpF